MVDYHKYDTLGDEGYFFIDTLGISDSYYITSKDGKFYKLLTSHKDMQELNMKNSNEQQLYQCSQDCLTIGSGNGFSSGIYYNGVLDYMSVNVKDLATHFNVPFNSMIILDKIILFDREGTLIFRCTGIDLLITKDNIYFGELDKKDNNDRFSLTAPKGTWKEIFYHKGSCTNYIMFEPKFFWDNGSMLKLTFCLRCGAITKQVDNNNELVTLEQILNTLRRHLEERGNVIRDFKSVEMTEDAFNNLMQTYQKDKNIDVRNLFANDQNISSFLCGQQWYKILKKKWIH